MKGVKPLVFKKGGQKRFGKGFSLNELKAAGITATEARKLGIPIDVRRKTAHEENIRILNELIKTSEIPNEFKSGKSKSGKAEK
ncbi:MAG: ribosomal protein L13e [Candidatus Bathyarchaeia archaeon]